MFENRRHFRLREFIDVAWKLEDQDVSGEGTVVNISSSGMLLQTDKVFLPSDDCVLSVEAHEEPLPFSTKRGKLVWFQRIHTPAQRYLCGVQFLADKRDLILHHWLEMKVNQLSDAGNATILGNLSI